MGEFMFRVLEVTQHIDESVLYCCELLNFPSIGYNISSVIDYLHLVRKICKMMKNSELFISSLCHSKLIMEVLKLY